jgi:Patatin-like phospholipase
MNFKELFLREQYLLTQADRSLAWDLSSEQRDKLVSTFGFTGPGHDAAHGADSVLSTMSNPEQWSLPSADQALEGNDEALAPGTFKAKRGGHSSVEIGKLVEDVRGDIKAFRGAIGQDGDRSDFVEIRTNETTGEPFVAFLGMDRTGLALSGGGIRSATFNLGLLQGLNHHNLLDLFDYLSTVSGGGYIGGWWSAWKHRVGRKVGLEFPSVPVDPKQKAQVEQPPEPNEIRHLREFSNFLIPRLGVFNMDMWYGVVAILSGMVPTLIMGGCLLGIGCAIWLLFYLGFSGFTALPLVSEVSGPWVAICSAADMAILSALVLISFELWWRHVAGIRKGSTNFAAPEFKKSATIATCVAAAAMIILEIPAVANAIRNLLETFFALELCGELQFSLVNPLLAWWVASLAVLAVRYVDFWRRPAASTPAVVAASSRVLGRLLGLTIAWVLLSVAWEAGRILVLTIEGRPWLAAGYGGVAVAAAETFRRVRSWMNAQPNKAQTGFFTDRLKPLIPQILAYFVVVMAYVLIAALVGELLKIPLLLVALTIIAACALAGFCRFLDPEALGLHWFYRERILRTYVGASNTALSDEPHAAPKPEQNRQTDVDVRDDVAMADLAKGESDFVRPLHLICCTANDLFGEQLGNLYRGARSAVLSPHGISIGDVCTAAPGLTLSNAQTASAAAFNSQMGSLSMRLGPAVSFLMAALNLRLGLWIRLAEKRGQELWRGFLLLSEFWSGTTCPAPLTLPHDVHLSDGGHFENLGLYELVRRHCRFIIASDCGADPEYKFDDLGAAMRRIRTDFGVEIDIDVAPLVPGPDGRAAQHMAVGTIYYDQSSDLGILLLFKPNLLGEEPDDVQQYRRRNLAFPQEPTGDQFYDEAQWESYRRLGEHAARSAFRFLERTPPQDRPSRYYVFAEAFSQWYPTSAALDASFLAQTERLSSYVAGLRASNSNTMIDELMPELGALNEPQDQRLALQQLMQLIQVMEDAFVSLRLDLTFTNPRTSGWDNMFRRSTESPLFRKWWPALQGLYSRSFRQFVNEEYGLKAFSPGSAASGDRRQIVELTDDIRNNDPVWKAIGARYPEKAVGSDPTLLFKFSIAEGSHIYTGMLRYGRDNAVVRWDWDDLFVLPPLWRINVQGTYLWDVLKFLRASGVTRIEVNVDNDPTTTKRTDAAFRAFQAERMRLYMALGFKLQRRAGHQYLMRDISVDAA